MVKSFILFFNVSLIIYGLLGLGIPLTVNEIGLDGNILGVIALYMCCIGTILVGIFPRDIYKNLHLLGAFIVFTGIFLTGIVFVPLALALLPFKMVFSLFNIFIVFIVGSLFFAFLSRKRHHSLFEWYVVVAAIVWNFSFCFMTVMGILTRV